MALGVSMSISAEHEYCEAPLKYCFVWQYWVVICLVRRCPQLGLTIWWKYWFIWVLIEGVFLKQGPTRHRPMAHPVVFRYLSYSTTLAEHEVHRLRLCLAFCRAGICFFLSHHCFGSHSILAAKTGIEEYLAYKFLKNSLPTWRPNFKVKSYAKQKCTYWLDI